MDRSYDSGSPLLRDDTAGDTGRFAPSPSGDLHIGNLRTALLAWLWAVKTSRSFVLRIEDIDRVRAGAAHKQIDDLHEIGIHWDGEPLYQSTRHSFHQDAIRTLWEQGLLFECFCSRRDIREASSAPHRPHGHYPGTCLNLNDNQRNKLRASFATQHRKPALRLRAPADEWTIHDDLYGSFSGPVDHFVIQRSDGTPAYNLAVVIDDAFQGVDQVTRGNDLLSQAPAQSALISLLDLPDVTYVHVPLALSAQTGARLAKRDGAVTLTDLHHLGWATADVLEWIGRSLGMSDIRSTQDLVEAFTLESLKAISLEPWLVNPPK